MKSIILTFICVLSFLHGVAQTEISGSVKGDPRNVNQAGAAEFFFGRPILPRRFFLTAHLVFNNLN